MCFTIKFIQAEQYRSSEQNIEDNSNIHSSSSNIHIDKAEEEVEEALQALLDAETAEDDFPDDEEDDIPDDYEQR